MIALRDVVSPRIICMSLGASLTVLMQYSQARMTRSAISMKAIMLAPSDNGSAMLNESGLKGALFRDVDAV